MKSSTLLKTLLLSCLGIAAVFANGQTPLNGDPSVLVPDSGIERPGYMHTNYVYMNPAMLPPNLAKYAHGIPPPSSSISAPFSPANLQKAYNISSSGGGDAIAIVDAYDYPTALADFNAFASNYSLPQESSSNAFSSTNTQFEVVYATGSQPAGNSNWNVEAAMDIEWAHAMAPKAKIYLVEASDNGQGLYDAVNVAKALPGVREISMSWGSSEYSGETGNDGTFVENGVVFFASSGDSAKQEYPSESVDVVGVGGTSLTMNSSGYVSESGWADSGGGPSSQESRPSFQNVISSIVGSVRGTPDVAALANPSTGVDIYVAGSWQGLYGGTSLACPLVAGITNSREYELGNFAVSSMAEETRIYNSAMGGYYHDVTSGSTANETIAVGWDYVTGNGSPNGWLSPWFNSGGNAPGNSQSMGYGAYNSKKWSNSTSGIIGPPVIGPDNTIYYANSTTLYGVSGSTGTQKWSLTLSGTPSGSPALGADGSVYIGTTASSNNIYSVNGSTGAVNWNKTLATAPSTGIALGTNSQLYVGCGGLMEEVSTSSGTATNTYNTGLNSTGTPILSPDGTLYFTAQTSSATMYAINSNTLTGKWSKSLGELAECAPVLGPNGYVYVGGTSHFFALATSNGNIGIDQSTGQVNGLSVGSDGTVYASLQGQLSALNGVNGAVVWSYNNTNGAAEGAPAIDASGNVYVGQANGGLTSITDGTSNWTYSTSSAAGSPSIGGDGTIYFVSNGLVALSAAPFTFTVGSNAFNGGQQTVGTITLGENAFTEGATISITSDGSKVFFDSSPMSITIASGSNQGTFKIYSGGVNVAQTRTVTATYNGVSLKQTIALSLATLSTVKFSVSSVTGGNSTYGEVVVAGKAGTNTEVVSLSSGNSVVTVPSSATIASGQDYAYFSVSTSAVSSSTNVTVTGTLNGVQQQGTLTVNPAPLTNLKTTASSVTGGTSFYGEVVLGGKAGSSGDVVSVSSDNSAAQVSSSTVTVPSGQTYVYFLVTTSPVSASTTVTLSATFNSVTKTRTVTVNPSSLTNFKTTATSVTGGSSTYGEVVLGTKAPTGGATVNISSANSAVQVPSQVTIPAGQNYVYFAITTSTVQTSTQVQLTATYGNSTLHTTLTVNP